MATLFEMTQQVQALYDMLQAEEIDEQVFADTMEAIGVDEKLEAYCKVIAQSEADTELYAREIRRLSVRKKVAERNIERMKEALYQFFAASGKHKLKAGTFNVSTAKSTSVNIIDENVIPFEYLKLQAPKVDKEKLKADLKAGKVIPGAVLAEKEGVRIR